MNGPDPNPRNPRELLRALGARGHDTIADALRDPEARRRLAAVVEAEDTPQDAQLVIANMLAAERLDPTAVSPRARGCFVR